MSWRNISKQIFLEVVGTFKHFLEVVGTFKQPSSSTFKHFLEVVGTFKQAASSARCTQGFNRYGVDASSFGSLTIIR